MEPDVRAMRVLVEMVDAPRVEAARPSDDAVDLITLERRKAAR